MQVSKPLRLTVGFKSERSERESAQRVLSLRAFYVDPMRIELTTSRVRF